MPDPNHITKGSVVVLKSGSPLLTVTRADGDSRVSVAWFMPDGAMGEAILPKDALKIVPEAN